MALPNRARTIRSRIVPNITPISNGLGIRVTVYILLDEMKGVFTNVEAIECDSCHDALLK